MKIPQNVIEAVSAHLSLPDVVSGYLTLERKNGRMWGLCPFHQEKTPSFSVSQEDNLFYCFGCHKGGNLFSFVQEMENLTFPEAVRSLAERAGVAIPTDDSPETNRKAAYLELYTRVAGSLHYILVNSEEARVARTYLSDRGVNDQSTTSFQLGYAPADRNWLHEFLKGKNYSEEFLSSSGLFSRKQARRSLFSRRLMFPIRDRSGSTIAFGARALENEEPKYLNSPDTEIFSKRSSLFGLHASLPTIRKAKHFVVAEGYLDVIALHQDGVKKAVAPLGTSFTETQVALLHRYADSGLMLFDGDESGLRAAEKSVAACERAGIESEVVVLPDDRDPADYMRSNESDELQNVLKKAKKGFTFILEQSLLKNDIRGAEGREAVLRQLLPFIDIAHSEVRKQSFLEEIADALQVDPVAVRADYARRARRPTQSPVETSEPISISNDLYLMVAVALNRSEFGYVRANVAAEDLLDLSARELYVALEESFRREETSMNSLLSRISRPDLVQLLVEKSAKSEFAEGGAQIIRDSVTRIKERSLSRRRAEVTAKMRHLERGSPNSDDIRPLLEDKMWIDTELQKLKETTHE